MDKANFYCYAGGKESESICNDITGEVGGVDWQLGYIDHEEFHKKIYSADLVIIVANLNDSSEVNRVDYMVNLTVRLNVPTLVFALYPISLTIRVGEKGSWLEQLENIRNTAVLTVLDDDIEGSNMNKFASLTQHYISEGLSYLSTRLMIAIRAIIDPVIRQELIGVDFADYRLAFANKGFYQIKEYSYEFLIQAEVNNYNWLQVKVIFATIYLNSKDAIDIYSSASRAISNMLNGSDALLLVCPVIEEYVECAPTIVIFYN